MVSVLAPAPITRARGPRIVVGTEAPRLGRPASPAVLPGGHRDQLVIVEALTEKPLMELKGAVVSQMSWVLNGIGSLTFSLSSWDPAMLLCLVDPDSLSDNLGGTTGRLRLIGVEVQWFRDGVLYWSGIPVSADVSTTGVVQFQCFDLGWYLTRRFFGAAQRFDLLEGVGSMDRSGLPGWTRNTVTAVRDTTIKTRGAGSARITGVGSISTLFTHTPTGMGVDLAAHLTTVVRLPAGTPVGTAIAEINVHKSPTGPVYDRTIIRTDEQTVLGDWVRVTDYALVPPGGGIVETKLYSRGGSDPTWFDDTRVQKNDTTGIPVPGADLATHAVAAMNHFQLARGKGTFRFKPYKVSNSGTIEVMGVRHMEHQQALDYLATLTDRDDGIDWWLDPMTRRFYIAARRGFDHFHLQFHERNASAAGWSQDEATRNSAVVVLGDGDGVDRPEGSYVDTSKVRGLVLEEAFTPPASTPLSAIDPMAKRRWQQTSGPQVTPDPILVSSDYLGELQPGDRIPTTLRSGVLRAEPMFRVQTVTLNLATEQLEVA